MSRIMPIIALALIASACSNKENAVSSPSDWSAVRANLAFTCARETDHLPPLDSDADQLFKYGRYLEKKVGPKDYAAVARYYRIAAAQGHYKANNNLQQLVSTGLAPSPDAPSESLDLAEQLIAAGIPGGYYDMGHYVELGYGVKQDEEKALRYFRKAADLGNPNAQYYVAEKLAPLDKAPEIAKQMRQCATDQGFGEAASTLGVDLMADKLYSEAVVAFQKGVAAGNTLSSLALEEGFSGPPSSNQLYYLALPHDPERSRRYKLISKFIDDHDGLNPKVSDIDQIVPLPPAKLPPWDGTFQWKKEQDTAQPPQKPTEALVTKLAGEKNLDPATGLPLAPVKSAKAERVSLGTEVRPGEVCPQDGYWCVHPVDERHPEATRRFSKGETMPHLVLNDPRIVPGLDLLLGMRTHKTNREWSLKAYIDEA
ncbi:MAG TPA: sel1 repeat family protein [Paraburkholderia sp.]|uniref:SEL1-like repeat protein n=1 Tax=Paraburkholderia sp. TaxID=1926495 RepID=UPI002ED00ACE